MSQVYYPNTSSITGNLISFSQTGQYLDTATVSSSLFQSFSESMLAVSKDCPNGVCGSATNSTTPLIDCKVGFANCTAQIPVYTDYYMSCIKTLVPSESDSLDSDISVLVDPASITVDGQVPSVIWNATIKDTANTTVSMNVLCTVLAAWSTRTENSELGTLDKELVTVYDSVSAATNPLIKDANSFNYQANCGKLAAPICQLYILGLVMNAPWNGINSVSGFANWGLNMLAIPVLQNTSATSLEKLAILEACMRFFVEDITKRVILSATASPDALTCTGCAFREARGTRKDLVLTFVGVISGFGFLLMLISVIWTFTKRTSIEFINAIDIAQLPLVSRNVRKQVLESLKPDEDVQFKAKIGILSDVVVEDEIEMAHISEDAGISSQNSWSSDKRKSFMGGLERRSLLVNTLGRDSVSANKRRSGTVGEYNLSMASPPYQSL
ncbi:hypothetical protein HDU83_006741 [Entophlyctis luteolus]|nr:hypothetical protein HDU83_006741 [Entophlyctis luteolus]